MAISVLSEAGRLNKVVIHRPGPEWDLVPCGPGALERYLIEDIFMLPRAQEEHDCFTRVLRLFLGEENVIELADLLVEVCKDNDTRMELIGAVTALESLGLKLSDGLKTLPAEDLANVLIRGANVTTSDTATYENLFPPLPNLLFTRDIGVAMPDGFIVAHANTLARRRETLLMRYILRHPIFEGANKYDIRDYTHDIFWGHFGAEDTALEGGDVLVVDDHTLFIGTGQRTTEAGFFALLSLLEQDEDNPITTVIRAVIPKERASMHLDTVITAVAPREFMVHQPVLDAVVFERYTRPFDMDGGDTFSFDDLKKKLKIDRFHYCGGAHFLFGGREQWTDGANLFAIAPGILLGYDRNVETAKELKKVGYKYLEPRDKDWKEIEKLAEEFKKTGRIAEKIIIGLPGAELSRARGGPRCMTMPLMRESVATGKRKAVQQARTSS